jgi:SAM-dependent methyltransferase
MNADTADQSEPQMNANRDKPQMNADYADRGKPQCATGWYAQRMSRQFRYGVRAGVVAVSLGALAWADQAPQDRHEMHRLHRDPKAYIAALEDPRRDAYQQPHEVLEALAIREGEVIADIGAGSGYFTFRFARHVGSMGRVYAVDIDRDMIAHVSRRAGELAASNVTPVLARPDDPLLPDASVDRIFFCDVWHHVEQQPQYLAKLKKALKPGGQIVMIDFHKKPLPVGPPLDMKIAREDLVVQMEREGFRVAQEHTFLPYQYFLVFEVGRR